MTEDNRPTTEMLVEEARKRLRLILDEDIVAKIDVALDKATEIWQAYDLLNRVQIQISRELLGELETRYAETQAAWPTSTFNATFVDPRKEGQKEGWGTYVMSQLAAQVKEYEKEQVEVLATSREQAIYIRQRTARLALDRAIENAWKLRDSLDASKGAILTKVEKLQSLSDELEKAANTCRENWPEGLFDEKFVEPKAGHETGWLAYVQIQVGRALHSRPDAYRVDRATENAEKILAVMLPDNPYPCRGCGKPTDGQHNYCDACHSEYLKTLVVQDSRDDGLHRAPSNGRNPTTAKTKRHAAARERHKANMGNKGKKGKGGRKEDEAGFEAAMADGQRHRGKKGGRRAEVEG